MRSPILKPTQEVSSPSVSTKPATQHPCKTGPGFTSPLEAFKNGEVENLLYATCIHGEQKEEKPDYLAVIDVNPKSKAYGQVVFRVACGLADELHHFGWNACSSCHGDCTKKRDKLVVCSVNSGNVYIIDTAANPAEPTLFKTNQGKTLASQFDVSAPHTVHCLASGDIMISTMGDGKGNAKGSFVLLDGVTFEPKGIWGNVKGLPFGYDFWYQPRHNVLVSTEWAAPKEFRKGFSPKDLEAGLYGHSLHFFDWNNKTYLNSIDLGADGVMPLEVRFLHDPDSNEGYVVCAMASNIFRIHRNSETKEWQATKAIGMDAVEVDGWILPQVPPLPTDCLVSMDDKYLYISNWLQGDIRQYDIRGYKRERPLLVGRCWIGGMLTKEQLAASKVRLTDPKKFVSQDQLVLKGVAVNGGPQMMQLSLDGARLYVTTSLFSTWDQQFYPDLLKQGSVCLKIDIDTDTGGMTIDENFLTNFGEEPDGPVLAHQLRYPGGDCTSDIWI